MDIDLTRLRHVVAIARTRSFSRAAEDLHITQPALSRSIAGFEQRVGLRLFDRDRSGVTPTAMGRLVIAEAERVLRAARDLDHNLRLYARGAGGDLAIGIGPLLAMLLPTFARRLLQAQPGVHLRASVRTPEFLVQELMEDRIELIFGNSWSIRALPDLDITRIGSVDLAFLVRTGHPLADAPRLTVADLARYPQASAAGTSLGGLMDGTGTFTCDNYHILRELVLESDCVWLASPTVLHTDIAEGRLLALDVDDFRGIESEVAVVRRRGRTLSPAAVELTRQLTAMLAKGE
ncbi:MAG: LysR family transcriptional regulator [Sphingomonadales bacterium]|nr:LysR family transcriptional regulator [Sphingomonadales bacterium]